MVDLDLDLDAAAGSSRRRRPMATLPPPLPPPSSYCSASSRKSYSQSRLHNFSFPSLSWGNHRLLRCMKVDPASAAGDRRSATPDEEPRKRRRRSSALSSSPSPPTLLAAGEPFPPSVGDREEDAEDEGLEKFKANMIAQFRQAFDKIMLPVSAAGEDKEQLQDLSLAAAAAAEEVSKPWNLRLRRSACNAPVENGIRGQLQNKTQNGGSHNHNRSPPMAMEKSLAETTKRPKFSPVLSRQEIEEDFLFMTGLKPPRRPRKRSKNVQRELERLYPGFWLTEVTPDMYKITEGK